MDLVGDLKWKLKRLLGRETDLRRVEREAFRGFSDPVLKAAMPRVSRTRFYRPAEQKEIAGWLTSKERQTLYSLALWLPGPILEIGPWVGLSTTAIARAIKKSMVAKSFDTVELNPSLENFREYEGKIGLFVPGDDKPHGICSVRDYEATIRPVLGSPGGVVGSLRRNLERLGLSEFVNIHIGDFCQLPSRKYRLIFCDSMHDEAEIANNAPHLRRFLEGGSILACHDVGHHESLIAALRDRISLGHGLTVDSLYVAEALPTVDSSHSQGHLASSDRPS
jgi:predicted O-methyltransferase YrrM